MEYLTSKEIANKWGIGPCRVVRLAREGRIEGAKLLGKSWMIPENAQKPIDGRTKQAKQPAKEEPKEPFFRFPFYVNFEVSSYQPPLTQEEILLRQAQLDFFACKFDQAREEFDDLLANTKNVYLKISALALRCILSLAYENGKNFSSYFGQLNLLLSTDLPYRKEMMLFLTYVYYALGQNTNALDCLEFETEYSYSPDSQAFFILLSLYALFHSNHSSDFEHYLKIYNFLCQKIEQDGHPFEAIEFHFILFVAYTMTLNAKYGLYHLRKALDISKEHNLIFTVAGSMSYYFNAINDLLEEYPEEFAKNIRQQCRMMHQSFETFISQSNVTSFFTSLTPKEYQFALYAKMRHTNKQIAENLQLSERTVANKYSEIYEKLGISSKSELAEIASNNLF